MTDATTTIARPNLVCAILAVLVLATTGAAARAAAPGGFTAPDDPTIPALISSLRGCLDTVSAPERRILALRAGLGGRAPQLTTQIAAAVATSPAATSTALVGAIRKLETLRRRGACATQAATTPAPAATKPAASKPAAAAKPAKATPVGGGSSDSTTTALEVGIPIVLGLAFLGGIGLEMNRRPREGPGAPGEIEAFDPYAGDG